MSADANWSPAMARQDISNQTAEHNAAMADETYDRNNWDDTRPAPAESPAELEADRRWLEQQRHEEWWA